MEQGKKEDGQTDFERSEKIRLREMGDDPNSSPDSKKEELAPGELVLGRYRIVSLIGAGASGSVYKVEQVFLGKLFALKRLHNSAASDVLLRRFQKEAQAASKLDHPNLARAVDFGLIADTQPCLVMDLAEGRTLAEYLKTHRKLSVDSALKVFIPVCFALDYAHKQGVIHRDIKPGNIVLTQPEGKQSDFVPKVVDFGIAKQEGETEALTKTGEIFGTPLYMSPEQCSGETVDGRSDIYSLGCVLFEALTGVPPFESVTALQTMMQHRSATPPSLKEASLGDEFPPRLESILTRMLAKEPSARYANCEQIAQDLIQVSTAKGGGASAKSESLRTTQFSHASSGDRQYTSNLESDQKLWIAPLAVCAIVTVSVAVICYILFGQPEAKKTPTIKAAASEPAGRAFEPIELATNPGNKALRELLDHRAAGKLLNLSQSKYNDINDTGLALFSEYAATDQAVETLDLSHCREITNDGLRHLKSLGNLKKLVLKETKIDDGGLKNLAQLKSLRSLDISHCDTITSNGLQFLEQLPSLTTLHLRDTGIDDQKMLEVAKLKSLKKLDLYDNPVTDAGVAHLKELHLQDLHLKGTNVTGTVFNAPGNLKELQLLNVDYTEIRKNLSALLNLHPKVLHISGAKLTDTDLQLFLRMATLEELDMDYNPLITNDGLLRLQSLPKLQKVSVKGTVVSEEGVKELRKVRPGIQVDLHGEKSKPSRE